MPGNDAASRTNAVNFLYHPSEDYRGVQDQIFTLVERHLPPGASTRTVDEHKAGAANFGLHIRRGRGPSAVPMPLEILMSHGLADKGYLLAGNAANGRRLINSYQHVLVPGPYFKDRLLRHRWDPRRGRRVSLSPDQIHIVGWPRLDAAFQATDAGPAVRHEGPLRVLWAPSHDRTRRGPEQRPLSSYPAFEQYLPRLRAQFEVRVSLHPSNRQSKVPTTDALDWADVVVSDFGTMLYEAWALEKTVIMPTWLLPVMQSSPVRLRSSPNAEGRIYREGIGNHARSIEELIEMATAQEPPDARVREFMDQHLDPAYRGVSAARIAALLQSLPLDGRARRTLGRP